MPAPTRERVVAPAKLTLSLRVVGRAGDGKHLLDAEMVTVDLGDVLWFGPGDGLEVTGPCGAAVPSGPDNLVRRALAAVGRSASVTLEKHVPPGAGLGGGSADAAAALRWAGCRDLAVAAGLGSDVPFCLVGGRGRVGGTGEVVDALPFVERVFTLVVPPVHVSTAAVYQAWDEMGGPVGPGDNDLERPALRVAPALGAWRDALGEATGEVPRLAGSGASWFVEGAFPGEGRRVVRTARP